MREFTAYLMFDGNCREAMTFYQKVIGGDLQLMTFGETHSTGNAETDKRIMHGNLTVGGKMAFMASDSNPEMGKIKIGDNFQISIDCESNAEVDKLFKGLSEQGEPTMPPADMFWGAYFGMCTDKFGVSWMFNCEKKQ